MLSRNNAVAFVTALLLFTGWGLCGSAAQAEDCWAQVAETADPDLTVTDAHGEKVTVRQILAGGQDISPSMMIMKALAGIDHFMRNPRCLSVYTDSLALMDAYVAYRTTNKGEEWTSEFASEYPAAAAERLAQIRQQSDALIAGGRPELIPEMLQNVYPEWQKTVFHSLLSLFDKYDLEHLNIPCQVLRKSALWSSALVTRMEHDHDIVVMNANWCGFEALNLPAAAAYEKVSITAFTGEPAMPHQIITEPRFYLTYSLPSGPPAWAYFSAWNWIKWQQVERLLPAAMDELTGFYQSDAGLSEEEARTAASNALLSLQVVERTLPSPLGDIRAIILHGRPLSEIATKYPQNTPDGFDVCDFRQLDKYTFNIHYPSAKDDDETCYIESNLSYRWEEHLALIGTPEPTLLISVLRPEVIAWLLDMGESIEQVNQYGKTALMTAAHLNRVETLRLLLQRGADVNRRTFGEIKVDLYPYRMYLSDTIRKPRSLRHAGRTALMYAAENADAVIIDLLLSAGADPCLADSTGLVPVDYFDGRAPSRQSNMRVTDAATRTRLLAALACPEDKRVLPAPFVAPTSATP